MGDNGGAYVVFPWDIRREQQIKEIEYAEA